MMTRRLPTLPNSTNREGPNHDQTSCVAGCQCIPNHLATRHPHQYAVKAIHPDDFLCAILEQDQNNVLDVIRTVVFSKDNPPRTMHEKITHLRALQLTKFSDRLKNLLLASTNQHENIRREPTMESEPASVIRRAHRTIANDSRTSRHLHCTVRRQPTAFRQKSYNPSKARIIRNRWND